ncbi:prolyl aminopeptidase [Leptothoe spongobia]|uniref:Proline iminopeptidase n=1 Tax=Leptothoe spongobia TAU-MAC 1115 TaxID=1967444 RepID=A0A947GJG7_9CYAN|nr:prolyl aminopeptidase [Leptothoe spongobia]MBT9316990.1 prolyl aminopeptidase [Leptothoe spongobia TAU-MAC 1115]
MRQPYPPIEPYIQGRLSVSDLHTLHFEEVGNPQGKPVVFLHGGPGGGTVPFYRQFFDPERWRVILFDQRGCGQSTPHADLTDNTTWDLVDDIERLRSHLDIKQWTVFGGSWGSTLALAYAERYPEQCVGLILRGIFMLRPKEIRWFYQEGASYIFPDAWEQYLSPIPEEERHDLVTAYYQRLTSPDPAIRQQAARTWAIWEASTSYLIQNPQTIERFSNDEFADAFARIECHYFTHGGFFSPPDQLLKNIATIRHIPAVIVQGRYDVVCPMTSAWELHRAWPEAELVIVPNAGHSATEPGILSALVEATDRFVQL